MRKHLCPAVMALVFCVVAAAHTANLDVTNMFPGTEWAKAASSGLGWSAERLGEARRFFDSLTRASLSKNHLRYLAATAAD